MTATKPRPEKDFIRSAFRVLNLQAIAALILVTLLPYAVSFRIVESLIDDVYFVADGYAKSIFDRYSADPGIEQARELATTHKCLIGYEGSDGSWYTDGQRTVNLEPGMGRPYYRGLWNRFDLNADARLIITFPSAFFVPATHIRLFLSWLGAPLVFFIVIYFLLRRTLYPLRWMQSGIQELTTGNFKFTAPTAGRDRRNALAQKFNAMTASIRALIQSKDQLIMDLSHELRSPITRIKVALALLPQDDNVASVEKNIHILEDMITTILETQRINLQSIDHRREPCRLAELIRECIDLTRSQQPGIVFEQDDESLVVSGDKGLVKLLLHNLLDNAVKYSSEDSKPVTVALYSENNQAVTAISDDGPGIPEELLHRVFEPFFKVAPERGFNQGYGLGLSLCRRIAELHGGTIELRNNTGGGLTARVHLPLTTETRVVDS